MLAGTPESDDQLDLGPRGVKLLSDLGDAEAAFCEFEDKTAPFGL